MPPASAPAPDDASVHLDYDATNDLNVQDNEDQTQSSKIKSLLGILKKVVGVKDLAAIRFSLPANLMEPIPNLEYWTYLDRADLFATIPDFDQPLDRMLAVLRFTLTKDLEIIKNGVCKPYNSILGEHFQCHWDVETPIVHKQPHQLVPVQNLDTAQPAPLPMAQPPAVSNSGGGTGAGPGVPPATPKRSFGKLRSAAASPSPANSSTAALNALSSDSAAQESRVPSQKRRITFLTEQVSHHPPVSTFYGACREAGIEISGVDQISGRFTGTSVRLYAGSLNRGMFLKLLPTAAGKEAAGERYRITHPTASINGLLRGSLWVSMADATVIDSYGGTRAASDRADGSGGTRLRALIEYKEEGWLTKAKYALEGVIYEYDWQRAGLADEEDLPDGEQTGPPYWTKVKQVPENKVVATFEGQWNGTVTFKLKGDTESRLLVNLADLNVTPKTVRPVEQHGPLESRRIWAPVTDAIRSKQYSLATKSKQDIEQTQRDLAAERKRTGASFVPQFFTDDYASGRPTLTLAGQQAIANETALP